jgi:microcompartment protein CcmL/EutN
MSKLGLKPRTIDITYLFDLGTDAMPMAVGVIETLGFPSVLASADAMVKSAAVTLVYYGLAESGRFVVAVRGHVAEVKRAVEAGIVAGEEVKVDTVITHYIVPNPPENVETILPIHFTEESEPFRF